MTTGYFLIVAVLLLGGVIATVGDRIGMRVGKARLSLFNLRPKQTATVISVLTGSVVSGTTLGLLFVVSDQLRTGVFELETLQADLRETRQELTEAEQDQAEVETALAESTEAQVQARQRLDQINRSLRDAIEREALTQSQLQRTQSQLEGVSQQARALSAEISALQSERQALIEQQQTVQAQIQARDREIAQRNQAIAQKEGELAGLQAQQTSLQEQISQLEGEAEGLRQGSLALRRNEPIVSIVQRVDGPEAARQLVAALLAEANRTALDRISAGIDASTRPVIDFSQVEVNRLVSRISDGDEYLVRVLPVANYVVGEPCVLRDREACVQVSFESYTNQLVYEPGQVLATAPLEPIDPTLNSSSQTTAIFEQISNLVSSSQARSVQNGVVGSVVQIGTGDTVPVIQFINQVRTYGRPLTLQTVVAEPTYTTGPLRLHLLALNQGEIVFTTRPSPLFEPQTVPNPVSQLSQ
ncbi:MAG: DUF3084 domain-containing protein [Cyanobacteria bacterium P01_C01_bin.73]